MSCTDQLRCQQQDAFRQANRLNALIDDYGEGDDAFPIAAHLARLLGILRVHLAREDDQLYPMMIASGDLRAAVVASRYQSDMGSLAWDLETFMLRWSSSACIATGFAAFRPQWVALFAALSARIECENTFLYPMADALPGHDRSAAA